MLLIWAKGQKHKVYQVLAHVLGTGSDLETDVHTGMDGIPNPPGLQALLCLGSEPLKVLAENRLVPKNRTITSLRATVIELPNTTAKAMVSYSPGISEMDYGKYVDLQCDLGAAMRLAKTGSTSPEYGDYQYVHDDFEAFVWKIESMYAETGKPVELALDLETIGFDPYLKPTINHPGAYIVSVQLSHSPGMADVLHFSTAQEEGAYFSGSGVDNLRWLLTTPKISTRGANLKFDLHWLWVRGKIRCTNFKFDTTLVGSLLDENRSNALDVHTKIYCPALGGYSDVFDRTVDKSRMDLVPKDTLLPYAGGDTDATHRVATAERQELLKDPALTGFYVNILHPSARAFELVEQGGVCVDLGVYKELRSDLQTEIHQLVQKARAIVGGRVWAKHSDADKPGGMNLTKASMLQDFMFGPMGLNLKPKMYTAGSYDDKQKLLPDPTPSTALEHLMMFKDVPEAQAFVSLFGDYASATKTLSTFVDGFLSHLRSDGRFHPSYAFFAGNRDDGEGGTVTGRLSCKAPAFQCMVGETLVLTDKGGMRLDAVVQGRGVGVRVLTHTGEWKPVIGVYENGVQPVFKVTYKSGRSVVCTGNHPLLTHCGFVRTDEIKLGFHHGVCYTTSLIQVVPNGSLQGCAGVSGVQNIRVRETGFNEEVEQEGCSTGHYLTQRLSVPCTDTSSGGEEANTCSSASGRSFSPATDTGASGDSTLGWGQSEQSLFKSSVGFIETESRGHGKTRYLHGRVEESPREIQCGSCGGGPQLHEDTWAAGRDYEVWVEQGLGITDSERKALGFELEPIESITPAGLQETYDLTIDGSHSFVANGIVVHNTMPKHTKWAKRIRKCFTAPPGHLVVERDYSQGELKVVACVANEQNMIKAYLAGMDLHVLTGGTTMGLTYEQMMALKVSDPEKFELYRQRGKPGNFGLLYGMSADGFMVYAADSYGVHLTKAEAEDFRTQFLTVLYPGLTQYHQQYKMLAHKYGQVRGPLGRIRHLPLINSSNRMVSSGAERQAINSPIQGTLSDMLIWTIALEVASGLTATMPCFGAIHDATYNYCHEDRVDIDVPTGMQIMQNLPFHKVGWTPQLQFTADAKIGPSMGQLEKYKG